MLYQDYLINLKVNGKSKNTIRQYGFLFKILNDWKPLESWDKATITEYIIKLQAEGYGKATIETRKTILKAFFKWAKKPEVIEDIKIKAVKNNLRREEILEIEDINQLIEATESHMYKALIALLFESGGRINEVLPIIVDEVMETDKGLIVPLHGTKTGEERRQILCIFSAQYIRNYINHAALGKKDRLFPVVDVSVWEMLKKIAKNAGIDKPVSAHKFRHSQATDMVLRGYNDSIIRKKLGWSPDSKVVSRYTHLINTDVIDATLEKAGQDIPRQPIANLKQAESLKIADASMQLSKLSEENETLKSELDAMKQSIFALQKAFTDDAKYNNLRSVNLSEKGIEIKADAPMKPEPIENPFDVKTHVENALKRKAESEVRKS